jgi:hypothetical protein
VEEILRGRIAPRPGRVPNPSRTRDGNLARLRARKGRDEVLGIRERSPALTEAGLVMNDGYSGPVIYVSYPPFPPRAKDILERRVLICATRVRGLHYPVWAAVVPPLKTTPFSGFAARPGATSRLSGQRKGPGTRKGKGKGMPGHSGCATPLYVGSGPRHPAF